MMNLVAKSLRAGGSLHPLLIPPSNGFPTNGTALFNPSIYKDDDRLLCTVRHCQYTILHSEWGKYEHQWGPLVYLCPEDDLTLTTTNYILELNPHDLTTMGIHKVDTSKFDVKPIWEFIGLEDARLFRWDGKLYLCGVRRDTTPNGQGRMELSELNWDKDSGKIEEVSRWRIPTPPPDTAYCEKNWVPILDMPWHFVKWTNPTEIVKVDPVEKTCVRTFLGEHTQKPYDFRGGSQVIKFNDYYITLTHVLTKFHKSEAGRKNAQYRHCFIVWDKDWNVVKYTEPFSFMDAEIEFVCGLAEHNGDYLISFGFQDNAAYLVKTPKKVIEEYIS